jgi:hypothetical protein
VAQLHAGVSGGLGYTLADNERVIEGDDGRSTVQKKRVESGDWHSSSRTVVRSVRNPASNAAYSVSFRSSREKFCRLKRSKSPACKPVGHALAAKQDLGKVARFLRCYE